MEKALDEEVSVAIGEALRPPAGPPPIPQPPTPTAAAEVDCASLSHQSHMRADTKATSIMSYLDLLQNEVGLRHDIRDSLDFRTYTTLEETLFGTHDDVNMFHKAIFDAVDEARDVIVRMHPPAKPPTPSEHLWAKSNTGLRRKPRIQEGIASVFHLARNWAKPAASDDEIVAKVVAEQLELEDVDWLIVDKEERECSWEVGDAILEDLLGEAAGILIRRAGLFV